MLEIVVLLLLSIVTSRLLKKRYRVAYMAHAVMFFFLFALTILTTDIPFIKNIILNWMGEMYYESLYNSVHDTVFFINIGVSSVVVIEMVAFVLLPLLSIVAFVKEIREQFKELKKVQQVNISSFVKSFLKLVNYPEKDFRHTQNETYLILGKLLN